MHHSRLRTISSWLQKLQGAMLFSTSVTGRMSPLKVHSKNKVTVIIWDLVLGSSTKDNTWQLQRSSGLYQVLAACTPWEAIDSYRGASAQVDHNRDWQQCRSFGQRQGRIQRQVCKACRFYETCFFSPCQQAKMHLYSHAPMPFFCIIFRRMFKKTIRAVAAANRLRSMTRSNTEMTNSDAGSLASSLATPESQQQQQQEQQQPQQAEAAVPVTAEKSWTRNAPFMQTIDHCIFFFSLTLIFTQSLVIWLNTWIKNGEAHGKR